MSLYSTVEMGSTLINDDDEDNDVVFINTVSCIGLQDTTNSTSILK